jgi:hypothetical protein
VGVAVVSREHRGPGQVDDPRPAEWKARTDSSDALPSMRITALATGWPLGRRSSACLMA